MSPTPASQPVAIVTGASGGLGAGMVDAFRAAGYAVVGTARSMPSSDDPDFLTVDGDLAQTQTAQRVVEQTLDRFGRIDSLVNMAGLFIGKPFTDYTGEARRAARSVQRSTLEWCPHRLSASPARRVSNARREGRRVRSP
jgi:NAD(P)-dependent dehydrogenase (short-subunit alcohol dehydrogenase family)